VYSCTPGSQKGRDSLDASPNFGVSVDQILQPSHAAVESRLLPPEAPCHFRNREAGIPTEIGSREPDTRFLRGPSGPLQKRRGYAGGARDRIRKTLRRPDARYSAPVDGRRKTALREVPISFDGALVCGDVLIGLLVSTRHQVTVDGDRLAPIFGEPGESEIHVQPRRGLSHSIESVARPPICLGSTDQTRAHRIEMDISQQRKEIAIVLNEEGFVSTLEEVTDRPDRGGG
jgi:hypothetical protein